MDCGDLSRGPMKPQRGTRLTREGMRAFVRYYSWPLTGGDNSALQSAYVDSQRTPELSWALRMKTDKVSELTTNRLSVYLRCLNELAATGVETVSSQMMAEQFNLNSAQI